MTPDPRKVAQVLANAAMANGGPAPDVDRLESALGRIAKQQAATLCRDAGALLAALEAKPLEVTQTSDPYGFIVGGVSVHNFSGDPDFSDDPKDSPPIDSTDRSNPLMSRLRAASTPAHNDACEVTP